VQTCKKYAHDIYARRSAMRFANGVVAFGALAVISFSGSARSETANLGVATAEIQKLVAIACPEVSRSGSSDATKITGAFKIEIPKLLQRIFGASISIGGGKTVANYENVAQEQLAQLLRDKIQCGQAITISVIDLLRSIEIAQGNRKPENPSNPQVATRSPTIIIQQASYSHRHGHFLTPLVNQCVVSICGGSSFCQVRGYAGPLGEEGSPIPFDVQKHNGIAFGKCYLRHPNTDTKNFRVDYACTDNPASVRIAGAGPGFPPDETEAGFGLPVTLSCLP